MAGPSAFLFPYGQYKGRPIREVPEPYLLWVSRWKPLKNRHSDPAKRKQVEKQAARRDDLKRRATQELARRDREWAANTAVAAPDPTLLAPWEG